MPLKDQKQLRRQYYNNIIGTLKQIIEIGIKHHKEKTGQKFENPAAELKRTRIKQKELQLPSRTSSVSWLPNCERIAAVGGLELGLVEFLACGGMRIASANLGHGRNITNFGLQNLPATKL